ncbi:hypothetical protein FRZ67_12235 [Panacibacter ginsenosidivorans]|uniref:Uncharacterized protein n=1 Tax=Panacibacter ginsenosidivorans TaxID=1813871 RepID=A0A5B8V9D4_9BACT|nr:hypothetical protein [Panacibacter ginsenosidivorans]QEC68034.1 hypothetical protein FRZ67_12235 [Panacibacter ginsenosidivorans]
MQRKFCVLLVFILTFITSSIRSQNPYYDAITISQRLDSKKHFGPLTLPVFYKYFPGKDDNEIAELLLKNPFLDSLFDASSEASLGNFLNSNILSPLGNLDVTNIADGFAKFLVKRTKEELNVTFFEKFKDIIHKPGYEDAFILFPQTCATLDAIGDQIYNYESYMNVLRESFESDINALVSNLPKIIDNPRHADFFNQHREIKSTCQSVLFVANELLNKVHPGNILADFDADFLDGFAASDGNNIKAAVQTLQLFSNSLRSTSKDHYWLSADSLKLLLNDPIALQIYFGLIYQQAGSNKITFAGNKDLQTLLKNTLLPAQSKIVTLNNFIRGFISQATILTKSIQNLSGKEADKLTFTDYYSFYASTIDLFQYATQVTQIPELSSLTLGPKFNDYLLAAKAAGNIALDISRKNYGAAIINSYQLYSFAFPGDETNSLFKKFLLQYGSFISSVAQAENSDDVEKAIEAAALPSGSSRVKRETDWNIALNGYVGIYYGYEKIKGVDSGGKWNSYGVTAPIGISLSKGSILKGKDGSGGGKSITAFISLIDLGAVTAFRFTNDSAEKVPTIELEDIVSPGIFLSYGLGKVPMSFNVGYQYGPLLRKVNLDENLYEKNYSRFSISLCVDIPFLNFYTKSK